MTNCSPDPNRKSSSASESNALLAGSKSCEAVPFVPRPPESWSQNTSGEQTGNGVGVAVFVGVFVNPGLKAVSGRNLHSSSVFVTAANTIAQSARAMSKAKVLERETAVRDVWSGRDK